MKRGLSPVSEPYAARQSLRGTGERGNEGTRRTKDGNGGLGLPGEPGAGARGLSGPSPCVPPGLAGHRSPLNWNPRSASSGWLPGRPRLPARAETLASLLTLPRTGSCAACSRSAEPHASADPHASLLSLRSGDGNGSAVSASPGSQGCALRLPGRFLRDADASRRNRRPSSAWIIVLASLRGYGPKGDDCGVSWPLAKGPPLHRLGLGECAAQSRQLQRSWQNAKDRLAPSWAA